MQCAIMQPTYLPWCGFFDLIDSVDHFIFLDNVKLGKSDWHVRNRIKSATGDIMLTVSVNLPNGRMDTLINQAQLNLKHPWRKKHLKSIASNYRKSPYFNEVYTFIEPLILADFELLSDFTINIIKAIASKLAINTHFYIASELPQLPGVKDERIVNICKQLDAKQYLSPVGAADYIERETPGGAITKAGISLSYQEFIHPKYPQLYGDFISHLSIIDLLFNCGFAQTIALIRSGHQHSV
ncbi:WbqC family protein [Colwellia sp. D2M02]|uniref:WbqC family protein n=1 Tax=Colwellia sp. D2M02 TaxID=2841562 RepID=UPI001C0804C3|nr:WbqC family protein [Colwellia sp. D2M02]MBU2892946.1 WbqC family protein [Colwellia sp. D2M02]